MLIIQIWIMYFAELHTRIEFMITPNADVSELEVDICNYNNTKDIILWSEELQILPIGRQ